MEVDSAVGFLGSTFGSSWLVGCNLTGRRTGSFGLSRLAGGDINDFYLARRCVTTIWLSGSGILAIRFTDVSTDQAGADRTVTDRSNTCWVAHNGVAWAIAGRAIGDGCHIGLPVGDGSRADRTADGAIGNGGGAGWLAGAGYVEALCTSWLADSRCRRPWTARKGLARGRLARRRLTRHRSTALDYVAGSLARTSHTDAWRAGAGLRTDGLADARDATRGVLARAGVTSWFTRTWNTTDRGKTDRLTNQSHARSWWADTGLRARWLTRTGLTADSWAAVVHRADRGADARRGAHRLTASRLTEHGLAGTRHSTDR